MGVLRNRNFAILFSGQLVSAIVTGSLSVVMVNTVPLDMRGRIFGTFNALVTIASPAGILLFGSLMTVFPIQVLFVVSGSLSIISGMMYFLRLQDDGEAISASV